MHRQIARNVIWLLAERAVQVAASIGTIAMIARAIGPEGFAHFQYAQALVLIASSMALICGAEVVVPRLVANTSPRAQHQLMRYAFGLREIAGIAAYAVLLTGIWLTGQDDITLHIAAILGLSIPLREPFGIVNAWMQAHTDNRVGVVFSILALTSKVGVIGLLFLLQVSIIHMYAWAFAIESAFLAALLARHYLRRAPHVQLAPDRHLATQLLQDGAIYWAGFVMMISARRVDQLMLRPQVSLADLGAYAATMQILDNFSLLATIVANTLAPLAIYAQPSLERVRMNLIRVAGGMVVLGTAGGALIALAAPWIVHLLYGSKFATAATLLQQAALATGLVFADAALTLLVVYLRKPGWLAIKWLLVFVTIAVVDWFMIPRIGASGAVLGYAAGNGLAVMIGITYLCIARPAAPSKQP